MDKSPLLFSTRSYVYLLNQISKRVSFSKGEVIVKTFPDGERYQRISTPVDDREVILVGGTVSDEDTLELFDLACAMVKHGAKGLTLIVPYFGYSTMERAVHPGEVVTAKARARLLSAIPQAPNGNRVVLMDLHSEGLSHYFEGGIVPRHLYAKAVVLEACKDMGGKNFVLASTDTGRAKWVESLANDMGVDAAFVSKRRIDGNKTEITAMNASVKGAHVIIYDDMIRTGGSLINAAQAYLNAGAVRISAIATHGVLPGNSLDRIVDSGLFESLVVTDTHPRTQEIEAPILRKVTVAGLFATYIKEHF